MFSLFDTQKVARGLAPMTLGLLLTGVTGATAQTQGLSLGSKVIETQVTEWDLPYPTDRRPGAMASDLHSNGGNKLWFVTRIGTGATPEETPRVYSLAVGRDFKSGKARWNSWSLFPGFVGPTGGVRKLKPSHDRRFVFVHTAFGLHKVDTANNTVTLYQDPSTIDMVSDVAVDSSNRVYYATAGVINRLNANVSCAKGTACPVAEVVKWAVGGTVGDCTGGEATNPCLAGVAVHPKAQHLVYFTDNSGNQLGELDTNSKTCTSGTCTSKVKRWTLPDGAGGPRQVNVDQDGIVWVIASDNITAHLVSLNPKTNKITTHGVPTGIGNDPWGVAPDGGMIGYTDFAAGLDPDAPDPFLHKVAMLIPRGSGVTVYPATEPPAVRTPEQVTPLCEDSIFKYGDVNPKRRTVPTMVTSNTEGVFIEALINQNTDYELRRSMFPLGITPDLDRSLGAFYYAVGEADDPNVKRIGHARLSREKQKAKHDRDDDDIDDDGKNHGDDDDDDDDGWNDNVDDDDDNDGDKDGVDDDDDNDGIKDGHDTKDHRESQDNYSSQMSAAQTEEFQMTAGASTLAMIVTAVADSPLAPISLEVRNPAGLLVVSTPPTPGVAAVPVPPSGAGIYTVRVKNAGLSAVGISTTLLTRELRLP